MRHEHGNHRLGVRGDGGVTLVELLVVIVILAILTALIVGVSTWVMTESAIKRTHGTMDQIRAALDAYHDVYNAYPDIGETATKNYYSPHNESWQYQSGAHVTSLALYAVLKAAAVNNPNVAKAFGAIPEKNTTLGYFKDGFGNYIGYSKDQGMGGRPLLVSPGPNALMKSPTKNPNDNDDIRSDGRGQQ